MFTPGACRTREERKRKKKKLTSHRGTAEVNTDCRPRVALQAVDIRPVQNAIPHRCEQLVEVRPAKVRARLQLGQGVDRGTHGVEHDVVRSVDVELLGEVGVDLEELDAGASGDLGSLGALLLERGQQGVEPLEGARVLAHPQELDAAEARGRVGAVAQMPYVLEDGGPWRHTDTGTDQDGDLVVEHVFGGGAVGPVDLDRGHLLTVLQSDLVHAHGVDSFVQLGLRGSGADRVAQGAGEITDLADVDRDVGVVRAGGDRERMPLVLRNRRQLDEQPLPSLVLERGLRELDLDDVCARSA